MILFKSIDVIFEVLLFYIFSDTVISGYSGMETTVVLFILRRFMETLWDNNNFVSTVIANLPPGHLITNYLYNSGFHDFY